MPSTIAAALATVPRNYPPQSAVSAKKRSSIEVFNYASDAVGVYNISAPIPSGARILAVELNTTVSTGTATLAIGIVGTAGKYRAAAALTTPDQWVQANPAAVIGDVLTADEQLIMTVAAAALPASGRLLVRIIWQDNS
jgi:hypothetical protein